METTINTKNIPSYALTKGTQEFVDDYIAYQELNFTKKTPVKGKILVETVKKLKGCNPNGVLPFLK